MSYRMLDPVQLIERVERLERRMSERFPDRNITRVCGELLAVARHTHAQVERIQAPIVWLRWTVAAVVVGLVTAVVMTAGQLSLEETAGVSTLDLLQTLDAVFNEVVLTGAALVFLVRTERRVKQQRTLHALVELRSIAHVIDEHQLDKDPDRNVGSLAPTPSSPRVDLSADEIVRYLNYCAEMLSTIGKLAALYVQHFDDDVAVAAVTEVEDLTLGLSAKIWQKIAIFRQGELA